MKIAFIGGVNYSYDLLSVILKDGWNVSIVFTYDESKKIFYSEYIYIIYIYIFKKHKMFTTQKHLPPADLASLLLIFPIHNKKQSFLGCPGKYFFFQ